MGVRFVCGEWLGPHRSPCGTRHTRARHLTGFEPTLPHMRSLIFNVSSPGSSRKGYPTLSPPLQAEFNLIRNNKPTTGTAFHSCSILLGFIPTTAARKKRTTHDQSLETSPQRRVRRLFGSTKTHERGYTIPLSYLASTSKLLGSALVLIVSNSYMPKFALLSAQMCGARR